MTPLQRWRRFNTERLLEPEPGSGIVRRGEVSLPWRQYVTQAARGRVSPALRVHAITELYEHTIAPCEHHTTVPVGEESVTWKEIKQRFLSTKTKYIPQATHLHEITLREIDQMIEWRCKKCDQSGFEDYTLDTLAATTHLVWHGCIRCAIEKRAWLDRRTFLRWGLGAGLGYAAWISNFDGWIPIPFVPPARAVADTFYVATTGSDTTGNGSSALPWRTYEKARTQMVANDGDVVLGRTGDYAESFNVTHQFPASTSFAVATIVGADSGHIPVIKPPTDPAFHHTGSARQYIIIRQLTFDFLSGAKGAYVGTVSTAGNLSTAAHHNRFDRCTGHHNNLGNGIFVVSGGHHHEFIRCVGHDYTYTASPGASHCVYPAGADNLIEGCEAYLGTGYLAHLFSDDAIESTDRSVVRSNLMHNTNGRGILVQPSAGISGADILIYNNIAWGCGGTGFAGGGALKLRRAPTNVGIYNNTVVDNPQGGIVIGVSGETVPSGTRLRNNISYGNTTFQFNDFGTSTDVTGSTNSWQIGGYNPNFVNQAGRDFHLTINSVSSINAGESQATQLNSGTFPSSPIDYDGTVRPQGPGWELGTYEFIANPPELPGPPWHRGRLRR